MDRKDLDRPEYGSYEDVHEQLVQAMQEACMNDTSREYKTPDIDMSFLYDDTVTETKTKHRFTRFNKVAAIVIATLLGLNAVLLISDSNEVYSEKGLLHRIYEGARGIFTDEDLSQFVEMDETGEVFVINDMKDIDKAKEFWPDLCVPEYVPEGFMFVELELSNTIIGEYEALYKFSSGNKSLQILISTNENEGKYLSFNNGKIVKTDRGVVNTYFDDVHNKYIADGYFDDKFICISGNIVNYEIINIIESIK